MKHFFLTWAIIGVILRLFIGATTFHEDIRAFDLGAYLVSQKGMVLSLYDYLTTLPADHPFQASFGAKGPAFFNYLPLTYFTHAVFMKALAPFYDFDFNWQFLIEKSDKIGQPALLWLLFLLKTPYLVFDLATAFLLASLFEKISQKKLVFVAWILNPVTLYATFAIGQFDIIPTMFVMASLWLVREKKRSLAVLSLGLGGAYKLFPLLLLPFLIVSATDKWKERFKLAILGLLPYFLTVSPFIFFPLFRQGALVASQSEKILFAKVMVSGAEYLSLFIVFYFLFFFWVFYQREKIGLWQQFLIITLLVLTVTHYHPQWFLWLTPFLVIDWLRNSGHRLAIILLFTCFAGITMLFDASLSTQLLAPVFPRLAEAPSFTQAIEPIISPELVKSLLRSAFAAVAIFLTWDMLRPKVVSKKA